MTSRLARALTTIGLVLLCIVLLGTALWGVLALLYFEPLPAAERPIAAAAFAVAAAAMLVGFFRPQWRRRAVLSYLALFALLLIAWFQISPSNDRQWRADQAVLPYATIDGDLVTVHNIRNFDYRAEFDWTPGYYDHIYKLGELSSVDLFAVYWMGPSIAHGIVSFGFADGTHLAVSIEARYTVGKGYSTVKGFFRQYEITYVVGDERDLIRLRTNYRKEPPEQVYRFALQATPQEKRRFFMNYIHKINALKEHPEFYNSLTDNCITGIWQNAKGGDDDPAFAWQLLLSGYAPEYLYQRGRLDTSVPYEVLRERGHVNERAHAADQAGDFSQRIRAPVAGVAP
jgi:hypothetical protein